MDKRKSRSKGTSRSSSTKIVDLVNYRKNKTEERRREYERVLFNRVLGVYSFLDTQELKHIEIIDISVSGVRFRLANPPSSIASGQKIPLRFYFTPGSYLKLIVEVKRTSPYRADGREGVEFGCEIDRETKSYEVMKQLVSFMQKYSELACPDPKPPMIWY